MWAAAARAAAYGLRMVPRASRIPAWSRVQSAIRTGQFRLRPAWGAQARNEAREAARLSRLRDSLNSYRPQGWAQTSLWTPSEALANASAIVGVGVVGSIPGIIAGMPKEKESVSGKSSGVRVNGMDRFAMLERARVFAGSERQRIRRDSSNRRYYAISASTLGEDVPRYPPGYGPGQGPSDVSGDSGGASGGARGKVSINKTWIEYD